MIDCSLLFKNPHPSLFDFVSGESLAMENYHSRMDKAFASLAVDTNRGVGGEISFCHQSRTRNYIDVYLSPDFPKRDGEFLFLEMNI